MRVVKRLSPPAPPPRPYAEFSLPFVIARTGSAAASAGARLDALEGTLAALTRRWHSRASLSPARDIRVAPETLDTLMRWVEGAGPEVAALGRLGVYHSGAVTDAAVPHGWIRVYLGGERSGPDERHAQHS